ncbi:unnamed protein product [Adineta steineri]|uniref:5'-nucleotidase n=1 Tax=Adineta steineri TaxID=433720 RepID=A0A814WRJ3_9BILA|nr:unnamed protein product [Adineta steineri]
MASTTQKKRKNPFSDKQVKQPKLTNLSDDVHSQENRHLSSLLSSLSHIRIFAMRRPKPQCLTKENWLLHNVTSTTKQKWFNYTKEFLKSFPNGSYDVLVALTHLDVSTDIELVSEISEIDLILGGHEHENTYIRRGNKLIPIYKADSNAFTVYIHRCAYNIDRKRLRIYSTLAEVSSEVPEEENTAAVANYWFNLGIKGFEALGFQPLEIVSCLPDGIELDGKYQSVTTSVTLLTEAICEGLLQVTATYGTTIAILNGGTIRIDDILQGTITQYDILRTLPFPNKIIALSVPGDVLAQVLSDGMSVKGTGLYVGYIGIETTDQGSTWLVNGVNVATSGLSYKVTTTVYMRENTKLNKSTVNIIQQTEETQTKALISYLQIKYPPC